MDLTSQTTQLVHGSAWCVLKATTEVSLLIAPEAQAAAVSEDQRLCAAGCDRDVRIFRADGANLKSMTSEMRLEGPLPATEIFLE